MNNCLFDNNPRDSHYINQKLLSFSFPSVSFEHKLEKYITTPEEPLSNNPICQDKDLCRYKIQTEFNQINLDSVSDNYINPNFIISNENIIAPFNEELIAPNNKGIRKDKVKNEKIFKIEKSNRRIGRIKKNSTIKGIHNKLAEDNIIRKIKGRFIEKLRVYINSEYQKHISTKSKTNKKFTSWLKRVNPKISRKIKKEENLKWFKTKISKIFSENISLRYNTYSPESNKKRIDRLLSLNEAKNVIKILNTNIELFYDKFINDEKTEGFQTLKDDMEAIKTHMKITKQDKIQEYLNKYEYIAKNLKDIFNRKNARNNNKKKNHKEI